MDTAACTAEGEGRIVVPRSVVTVVVIAILLFVGFDLGLQAVIPGHTANPLIDGPLIALLASILIGKAGPKPEPPESSEREQGPTTEPASGKHRGGAA
ncbi:MAG: hypothetical protein L0I76_36405 [Pseudonocardia sp.]|nr:hypothetical protein [Pseudonocardia sp.]